MTETTAETTASSYAEDLRQLIDGFTYERCADCGKDLDAHLVGADMFGKPHAWCREGEGVHRSATVEVVVLRDPDASNTYDVFINGRAVTEQRDGAKADGVTVLTYDIDAGSSIEHEGPEVARQWADFHRASAAELLSEAAVSCVVEIVAGYDDDQYKPAEDDESEDESDEDPGEDPTDE
jgi:hypothetical protein